MTCAVSESLSGFRVHGVVVGVYRLKAKGVAFVEGVNDFFRPTELFRSCYHSCNENRRKGSPGYGVVERDKVIQDVQHDLIREASTFGGILTVGGGVEISDFCCWYNYRSLCGFCVRTCGEEAVC